MKRIIIAVLLALAALAPIAAGSSIPAHASTLYWTTSFQQDSSPYGWMKVVNGKVIVTTNATWSNRAWWIVHWNASYTSFKLEISNAPPATEPDYPTGRPTGKYLAATQTGSFIVTGAQNATAFASPTTNEGLLVYTGTRYLDNVNGALDLRLPTVHAITPWYWQSPDS